MPADITRTNPAPNSAQPQPRKRINDCEFTANGAARERVGFLPRLHRRSASFCAAIVCRKLSVRANFRPRF